MAPRCGIRVPSIIIYSTLSDMRIHPLAITNSKGTAITVQAWTGPEGSMRMRLPDCQDSRHIKVKICQAYPPAAFTPRNYSSY
jgi:hypothetical protein